MSYDITLVRRRPGQSWDDAFAAARRDADAPLGAERLAVWPRIELRVAEILGEGTESAVDATAAELTHMPTGVQVSLFAGEAAVTYPYWEQPDPELFHRQVAAVVAVVEEETGLSAYDEQTGAAFDGTPADEEGIAYVRMLGARDAAADAGIPLPGASLPTAHDDAPDLRGAAQPGDRVRATAPADRGDHRRALRYLITGVVILALAVPLLFLNPDPSFFGYLAVTIGAVDTVVGLVLWRRARR